MSVRDELLTAVEARWPGVRWDVEEETTLRRSRALVRPVVGWLDVDVWGQPRLDIDRYPCWLELTESPLGRWWRVLVHPVIGRGWTFEAALEDAVAEMERRVDEWVRDANDESAALLMERARAVTGSV